MRVIILIIVVAGIFVLYLVQHRCSVATTQKIMELEKTKQLLTEEVITLQTQCVKAFLFTNLYENAVKLNLVFAPRPNPSVLISALTKSTTTDLLINTTQKP